jgi:hypothetical protein
MTSRTADQTQTVNEHNESARSNDSSNDNSAESTEVLASYPLNPSFGHGIYRRKVSLSKQRDAKGDYVAGQMEDCMHGFTVKVYFNEHQVTAIDGEHKRSPFTGCEGAKAALDELIGTELGLSAKALSRLLPASSNCTHWLDLSLLCIQHASRDEQQRIYSVEIADEDNKATQARIYRNDTLCLSWQVKDWCVQAPEALAGNTLSAGFSRWANEAYQHDAQLLEAAYILQKGYFVSTARRYDLNKLAGEPASQHKVMLGACYTYSKPQFDHAVRAENAERDFTQHEELLLKFL